MPRPECNTVQGEWCESTDAEKFPVDWEYAGERDPKQWRGTDVVPPPRQWELWIVTSSGRKQSGTAYLGEANFCPLPKRQYRVQAMIDGGKNGGEN